MASTDIIGGDDGPTPIRRGPGACQVCSHTDKLRIELLICQGASLSSIARKFNISPHAVGRHSRNHIDAERRARLAVGPVARVDLESRVAEESESIIDHLKVVRSGLYTLFQASLETRNPIAGANVAGRLISCLTEMGKFTGQIAASPLLQVNQQFNINNLASDPSFARFQADLIRVLSKYPEARAAVLAEFERLEASSEAPSHAPVALIEHANESETASEA